MHGQICEAFLSLFLFSVFILIPKKIDVLLLMYFMVIEGGIMLEDILTSLQIYHQKNVLKYITKKIGTRDVNSRYI